jgi:predicted peptidase
MTRKLILLFVLSLLLIPAFRVNGTSGSPVQAQTTVTNGEYKIVVEGYDWGPAISKVILSTGETISSVNKNDFTIYVVKSSDCGEIPGNAAKGERTVINAYVSDEQGNKVDKGGHIVLVLAVAPDLPLGSPFQYYRGATCSGNKWVDYNLTIINAANGNVWNKEVGQMIPLVDKFNLKGSFTLGNVSLKYAWYEPKPKNAKSPLIIWLHGGGEGGTDPTIPLLGNRAANYAADEIQFYFEGAYVLVPQCPTRWMDNGKGGSTSGQEDDMYYQALMALIKDYVAANPGIDADRIYVGGCSNGGYMSMKLLLKYPAYFAAGYISSLAYQSEYITDEQIKSIKNIPIWFVQSADDGTTIPDSTVVPVYKRLIQAGAKNVHFSFYNHVVDITGFYGGDNYLYSGHWSWVYLHANKCRYDYDGSPVKLDGRPVTIMEWLAAQSK